MTREWPLMQVGAKKPVDIESFGTEAREVAACNFKGFASSRSGSCTSPVFSMRWQFMPGRTPSVTKIAKVPRWNRKRVPERTSLI